MKTNWKNRYVTTLILLGIIVICFLISSNGGLGNLGKDNYKAEQKFNYSDKDVQIFECQSQNDEGICYSLDNGNFTVIINFHNASTSTWIFPKEAKK